MKSDSYLKAELCLLNISYSLYAFVGGKNSDANLYGALGISGVSFYTFLLTALGNSRSFSIDSTMP